MTNAAFDAAVDRIRAGNREGLREIYDAYGDKVYRLFLGKVRHREDAEDLTSDFFLKLWELAGTHRSGTPHKSWMMTIARNMAVDHLRRVSREIPDEDVEMHESLTERTTAEDTVLGEMSAAHILSVLPESEREIVMMHLSADLTFREIAEVLGIPLGTAVWKYRSAIGKLQRLAKEGKLL